VRTKQELDIDGQKLAITNVEKIFYPAAGFTKGQVIDYYIRVSKYMLPHLKDRPVTLKRYPDGIEGKFFYEKNAPRFTPKWVPTFPVPRRAGGPDINYIMVNNLPTLVWCANIATIEFHPFLHRKPNIQQPTEIVFDLDPGEGLTAVNCVEVAFILREVLSKLKLKSFPKVSGSKGIQIYVPLNTPATYDVTRAFARSLARLLERQHPKLIISDMDKSERKGKVFIDWSQNSDFKTTIGVYSMRTKRDHPFISAPVSWDELKGDAVSFDFSPQSALDRCEKLGDLFAPVLKLKQRLPQKLVDPD